MALAENENILLEDMQNNSSGTNNNNIGLAARNPEVTEDRGLAARNDQEARQNIGLAARGDELPSIEDYPQVAGAMSVPSSSPAYIHNVDIINEGELNLQERVLQEKYKLNISRQLKEAGSPNSVFGYYGSFNTEIDFNEATYDPETNTYSDVVLSIEPNHDIPGYEAKYGYDDSQAFLPDGLTKKEILKVKREMESKIMKSGDLTYSPDSILEGLGTVKLAETTTGPQAMRAFLNIYPLKWGFKFGAQFLPDIEKGKKFKRKNLLWAFLGFGAASTALYKLGNEAMKQLVGADFDVQGYAQVLYAMQEAELQIKGIDPTKARTLSVQQYAALLDPVFGSYWTKFVNTLTEGAVGTTTFLGGLGVKLITGGGLRVNAQGELVSLFGKKASIGKSSANAYIVNVHKRAMDKLNKINTERVAGGLEEHIITKKRVLSEAQLILKDDKLQLKEAMPGAVFRMIYGFKETQKGALFLNKPLYYAELGFGEGGAGGLVAFESYYRAFGRSERTEDIDKLPFLVAGAILGPQTTVAVTAKLSPIGLPIRMAGGIVSFIGDGTFGKSTFDFLLGKIPSLPDNMPASQRKAILDVKRKIGVMDQELQGDVTRSLQTGIELTNNAVNLSKRLAKQYNDPTLILTPTETLSTFTGLEVIAGLEGFLMKQVMSGRATSEAMQATTEKLFKARSDGKDAADRLLKKLILMGEKSGVLDNKQYLKVRSALEKAMLRVEGKAAVKHNMILNDVLTYEIYNAFDNIVENPMEGTRRVEEVIKFLKTEEGKDLVIVLGEKEFKSKEAAIQLNILASEQLDIVYRTSVDKSIAAHNIKWQRDFDGIGPPPPPKTPINPTEINHIASEHLARTLNRRVNQTKDESRRLYRVAWKGKDTVEIDVTNLYTEMAEDVIKQFRGADSVVSGDEAAVFAVRFFRRAAREAMDRYLAKVGEGSIKEGRNHILALIKSGDLRGLLSTSDLADPHAFAKAMLNEENMDTLGQKLAGDFDMKILTAEFNTGINQIKEIHGVLVNRAAAGNLGPIGRTKMEEVGKVLKTLTAVLSDSMSDAEEIPLLIAENYWKRNVLDVRETTLFRSTLGGARNNDFSDDSILGRTFVNNPIKWAENIWSNINSKGDASVFFDEFNKIFPEGTPERKMALEALDDAAISNAVAYKSSVGNFPVQEEILPKGSSIPKIIGPEVRTVSRIALDPEDTGKVDTAFHGMRQKTEWMRQASKNEYFSGSYDIFEKVATAVKYSKEARNKVNMALKILANEFHDKTALVQKSILGKLQLGNRIIQETMGAPMGSLSTNNPGLLIQEMLSKPERFDAVRSALIDEFGAEEARLFLRTLFGKGIHDISTPSIKVGKTPEEKMSVVLEEYDPLRLSKLLEDNEELLKTIFEKEHFEDIKMFAKFMLRMTPDADAAEKLGGGYAGTFKRTRQFSLSHASIISRVYAAESGRTSFRYIGAEAVLGVMLNSNNDVLTAIFMDQKIAKELSEFLLDPTKSIRDTQGNVATWVHELTGLSQAVGGAVFEVAEAAYLRGESYLPTEDALIRQARMKAREEDKVWTDIQESVQGYGGLRPTLTSLPRGSRADRFEIDEDTGEKKLIIKGEDIEAAESKAYDSIAPDLKEDLLYIVDEAKQIIEDETQQSDLESIQDIE